MIDVYVNESGDARGSPTLIAAGFIAKEETWRTFTDSWKLELR